MNIIKRLSLTLGLLLLASSVGFAQATITQTTLASAVNSTAATITVASASGFSASTNTASYWVYIDQEAMQVMAVNSTTISVLRGIAGTDVQTHPSGAIVWFAPSGANPGGSPFVRSDPQGGSCVLANEPYTIRINTITGYVWSCTNSLWQFQQYAGVNEPFGRTVVSNASYSVALTDYLIVYTSLSGSKNLTLPAATGLIGHAIVIKDEGGNALANVNTIAIVGTIDGVTTKTVNSAYGVLRIYSNGVNWFTW